MDYFINFPASRLSAKQKSRRGCSERVRAASEKHHAHVKVGELDNAYFLTATKNYFSDEWYEVVEQNRPVNAPFNFVQQAQKNVSLTDVTIHSIEETDDGYNVLYTLYLAIGDDTEVIEKTGSMTIVQHDSHFLITYDKEKMIIVDGIKFF